MTIGNEKELPAVEIANPETRKAAMKVLIGAEQGWRDHVMRVIELGENGCTPRHSHPWPHINYMLEGQGILHMDGKDTIVEAGAYAYVPANCPHQFVNEHQQTFRFICIVPTEGHVV